MDLFGVEFWDIIEDPQSINKPFEHVNRVISTVPNTLKKIKIFYTVYIIILLITYKVCAKPKHIL